MLCTFRSCKKQTYAKLDLLIIDEWLLRPLSESEAYDLLEIIEVCSREGAMIFCTQYDTDEWYYRIDCDRPDANVKHFFTPLGKDFFPCTVSSFLHRSVR